MSIPTAASSSPILTLRNRKKTHIKIVIPKHTTQKKQLGVFFGSSPPGNALSRPYEINENSHNLSVDQKLGVLPNIKNFALSPPPRKGKDQDYFPT